MTVSTIHCPRCGNAASGNFCTVCGASLAPDRCTGCTATLAPGARFCHRCGAAARGAAGPATAATAARGSFTPWVIATVLTLGAISMIVYAATRRDAAAAPDMANAGNASPQGTAPAVPAPDISNMTPREQFDRLYDRVMTSAQGSDTAAVIRFWPMASGAYAQLPTDVRDNDARFHMADLHLLVGQFPPAVALADTILAGSRDNLLAHYIKALAAEFQGDSVGARSAQSAFLGSFAREIDKPAAEYTHHRAMLDQYRQTIVRK